VARDEAWPQQLAALGGKPVYNMGVNGYGAVQELALMKKALAMHPQSIVVAFYSGNDLYDAFDMVYAREQMPQLRAADPHVLHAIEKAEAEQPLAATVDLLFQAYIGNFDPVAQNATAVPQPQSARQFLSEHSRLWALVRATRRAVVKKSASNVSPDELWAQQTQLAAKSGGLWIPFSNEKARTIFMPQYRLNALNMEDPRIQEGLRISIDAIKRMDRMAHNAGVNLTVIFIPTKELVFFDAFDAEALQPLTELVQQEKWMWAKLAGEIGDIPHVDMLPVLRDSLRSGISPYQVTIDGHPNSQGHRVLAAAVFRAIEASNR
jgi:hypothetical protein